MIWFEPGLPSREPSGCSAPDVRRPPACSNNRPHRPSKRGSAQPRPDMRSKGLLGCDILQQLNVGEVRRPSFRAFERRQVSKQSRIQGRMPRSLMATEKLRRYSLATPRAFSWNREMADHLRRSKSVYVVTLRIPGTFSQSTLQQLSRNLYPGTWQCNGAGTNPWLRHSAIRLTQNKLFFRLTFINDKPAPRMG